MKRLGGWAVWGAMLLLAWTLPGRVWKPEAAMAFPWRAILPFTAALAVLVLVAVLAVARGGPSLARSRGLAAFEAPPTLLWGVLVLVLWPASLGPPGLAGWLLAFLLSGLPLELRWLSQALPPEQPFPAAWGKAAIVGARRAALRALVPRWIAARLPVWLTAVLVLERLLGVAGPGSDWVARVGARDRFGVALWVAFLAGLWAATRPLEREAS